jgi:polyisoprenoid-binding protein YceI
MPRSRRRKGVAFGVLILGCAGAAAGQPRPIDAAKSAVTIQVKKAGLLSAFGHDHEIAAPAAGGTVDSSSGKVELRFRSAALEVRDRGVSEKDRAEILSTMLGPQVLDSQRYPEIVFRSSNAKAAGAGAWHVEGELTLHGETRPVTAEVLDQGGHYTGTVHLKQTEFGIKPVKVAGGAVRVKDEIQIDLDIQLAR